MKVAGLPQVCSLVVVVACHDAGSGGEDGDSAHGTSDDAGTTASGESVDDGSDDAGSDTAAKSDESDGTSAQDGTASSAGSMLSSRLRRGRLSICSNRCG